VTLLGGPAPDESPSTFDFIDGVAAIRPDEPGSYTVCAAVVVGGVARNACTDVVYTGAAMEVALTIQTPTAFLTGRVLVDEQPLAGVAIGARGTGPGSNFGAVSGADGSFKSPAAVRCRGKRGTKQKQHTEYVSQHHPHLLGVRRLQRLFRLCGLPVLCTDLR
jgi:hypothetical protein